MHIRLNHLTSACDSVSITSSLLFGCQPPFFCTQGVAQHCGLGPVFLNTSELAKNKGRMQSSSIRIRLYLSNENLMTRLQSTRRQSVFEGFFWSVPITETEGTAYLFTKWYFSLIEFSRCESCFSKTGFQTSNIAFWSFAWVTALWIIKDGKDVKIGLWRKQKAYSTHSMALSRTGVWNTPAVHALSWRWTVSNCLEEWNLTIFAFLSVLWKMWGGDTRTPLNTFSCWCCKFFLSWGNWYQMNICHYLKWNMIAFPISSNWTEVILDICNPVSLSISSVLIFPLFFVTATISPHCISP